jgi:hypothetical protein
MAENENAYKRVFNSLQNKSIHHINLYGNDTQDMPINHEPFHIKFAS